MTDDMTMQSLVISCLSLIPQTPKTLRLVWREEFILESLSSRYSCSACYSQKEWPEDLAPTELTNGRVFSRALGPPYTVITCILVFFFGSYASHFISTVASPSLRRINEKDMFASCAFIQQPCTILGSGATMTKIDRISAITEIIIEKKRKMSR